MPSNLSGMIEQCDRTGIWTAGRYKVLRYRRFGLKHEGIRATYSVTAPGHLCEYICII